MVMVCKGPDDEITPNHPFKGDQENFKCAKLCVDTINVGCLKEPKI